MSTTPPPPLTLCENNHWCTYQAIDYLSITILQTLLLCHIIIGCIAIRNYYRLKCIRSESEEYKKLFGVQFLRVYWIVFAWTLFQIVKIFINVYAYYGEISGDHGQDMPEADSPIVVLSAVFNTLDMCCTFCVLTLVILIPYEWFKFLLNHINQQQGIALHLRIMYSRSFKLLKFMKYYMFARIFFIVWNLLETIFIILTDFGCRLPSIDIIIIAFQSVFILLIYLIIFYVAEITKKQRLVHMELKDYKRIRIQYFLLIIALFARIVINIFFNGLIKNILNYEPDINCQDKNPDNEAKRSVFLVFAYTIMHFLPIGLVIYIYQPDIKVRERDQAILKYQGAQPEVSEEGASEEDGQGEKKGFQKTNMNKTQIEDSVGSYKRF